jgi:hypothetical protein
LTKYGELGIRGAVFLVWLRGLRSFCTKSRRLRQFFRQVNPATPNHDPKLFPQYMRRAVEILSVFNCPHQWLVFWATDLQIPAVRRRLGFGFWGIWVAFRGLRCLQVISLACGQFIWRLFSKVCVNLPSGDKSLNCLPCFRDSACGR